MTYSYDRATSRVAASRLDSKTRSQANQALRRQGFDGNGRFRSVGEALNKMFDVLGKFGIEQDETLNAWKFKGQSGTTSIDLAFSNTSDPFAPESIENTMLALQWTELRQDHFEVLAYLS